MVILILEIWKWEFKEAKSHVQGPETGAGGAGKDVKFSMTFLFLASVAQGLCAKTGALPLMLASLAFESGIDVDLGVPHRRLNGCGTPSKCLVKNRRTGVSSLGLNRDCASVSECICFLGHSPGRDHSPLRGWG